MLKIGGRDVIYSNSFLMLRGEEVVLTPPGVIGRSIKIIATTDASADTPLDEAFLVDESDVRMSVLTVPFCGAKRGFAVEFEDGQLMTATGRLNVRMSGRASGPVFMEVHVNLLETKFDNYIDK